MTAFSCRRRTVAAMLLLLSVTAAPVAGQSLQQREAARISTIARVAPTVVCVMSPTGQGGGSGVLISADGFAISNYHVTSACGDVMKCGLSDGRIYDAVIVGLDPTGDIAMLQLQGRSDFTAAEQGDSDRVSVGDEVLAMGNPFLLAEDFTPTVTFGIVSGVHRYQYPADTFLEYTDCIQIDASINPGNSGGPLFDINGRWIGINGRASFEKRGRVNAGAAYAISVKQVQLFLGALRCGLIVDHGRTDFTVETLTDGRVVVDQISEVSEAWRRGLRPQAEIIAFAGRQISSANDFQNVLGIFPEGTRVPISWRDRDGVHAATLRLLPLHAFQAAPELPAGRLPEPNPDPGQPPELQPEREPPSEIPESLKHLFVRRDGFANYHFNQAEQQRLLTPLQSRLEQQPLPADSWRLQLVPEDTGQRPLELIIGDAGVGLTQAGRNWYQPSDESDPANEPADFPGLLTAAGQLRKLLSGGPAAFDDVVAAGSFENLPTRKTEDVIISRDATRVTRWSFPSDAPMPFAMATDFAAGSDECRLLLADWKVQSGLLLPSRFGFVEPDTERVLWLMSVPISDRENEAAVSRNDARSGGEQGDVE